MTVMSLRVLATVRISLEIRKSAIMPEMVMNAQNIRYGSMENTPF
jgi:hypothetical protein